MGDDDEHEILVHTSCDHVFQRQTQTGYVFTVQIRCRFIQSQNAKSENKGISKYARTMKITEIDNYR